MAQHRWVCGFARDNAGNQRVSSPAEFRVDKNITSVTVSHVPQQPTTLQGVTITSAASDAESGMRQIRIFLDGSLTATCSSSPCTFTEPFGLSSGTHSYFAIATDNAGNQLQSSTQTVSVVLPAVINLNLEFPDEKELVITTTPITGYPNFTKPMPVNIMATGQLSTNNAQCTSSNCLACTV